MKRNDTERLLISFIIAAAMFGAAAGVLHFIDFPSVKAPEYHGPVFLIIEEDPEPEVKQEPLPSKSEEQPSVRKTGEPSGEARSESPPEGPAPSTTKQRDAAELQDNEAAGGMDKRPAEIRTEGIETGSAQTEPAPTGDAAETTAPRTEAAEVPAPGEAAEPEPAAPVPEQPGEEDGPGETAEPEPEAAEGPAILDLAKLDAALPEAGSTAEDAAADGGTDAGEEAAGEGPGAGNGGTTQLGTIENPIDFDTLTANRKPLYTPDPDINPELASGLPRFIKIVTSFTLLPSGYITDLNITTDSGNTKVDSIIKEAIRKWRFEPVSPEAGSIQVRVRYDIRVR